ncbi:TetR/AcrR family transcriptional regulator [Demequina lignilytica]|uniref:TetR/AcrR family transcriptional regulator n=1 Tax=Demequina lignilytica TaxID=3051663 RepID=A0AAW7M9W5_9MICO|nr:MULTISPECIES: TetR/AcrR family transcriptional regulator [unclassified Demequina]MDN4479282.1 TetR/AcrR family transcriptional regulator [Demequina sp. SYSU T00039-1]MDN4483082.1 TetR/AcrR family transcriptional regulator [Demequina sp. SYSU T0a273]MDN4488741.1 TetR/AcrR family transcriptional regulator [Demequina sp. SYSU T00039]MDN4490930.1 TetR/AcrR family transcriptional regulator [Demequina sp. SYSU T00068]
MTTDPRFARSADALARAVLELAAETPIEDIAVTDIARRAGVTRATFYNHANGPEELLARVLGAELDQVRQEFLDSVSSHLDDVEGAWRETAGLLMDHIDSHADVYRTGLSQTEAGRGSMLALLLANHIEGTLERYRQVIGAPEPKDDAERARARIAAAYLSHGVVGGYRAFLTGPEPRDRDLALDVIVGATPREWFATPTP